jgi:hypothetical protein
MKLFIPHSRLVLFLLIFPTAMAHAQFVVQSGVVISTNGNAVITLQDIDLVINGGISQQAGDGYWFFTGSGNNTISGSSSPFFDRLDMAKTGSAKIILSQNISGASITSAQNLGSTVIRRGHGSQTNSGGAGSSILRYYDILPANNTALNATLRINYLDAELNGLDESALVLSKSTDQLHWTNIGYTARDTSANYVEDSAIADFSRWTLSTANNPLPVKLTSFTVECLDGSARISWVTAQEQNSSRFDVEKSVDGIQWQTIGSMAAAGNSALPKNYSYVDGSTTSGTAFYRVAEFDIDGMATYSTTAAANCTIADNDAHIYPNPVKDILWVTLNTPVASVMKIEIYNAGGAKSQTQNAALIVGDNRIGIDMKGLTPGLYFLNLQWGNGHRTKITKIEKE